MSGNSGYFNPEQYNKEEVLFDGGGTADCYKLIKDNRIYCVKRPKPQFRDSEAYMSLFRKEFELGIDLEHPNIVRYFAYDIDERGPFIRMDYVDGDNLEEFVAQHPDYLSDKNNRKRFLDELFSAINYLHEKGLLHLDLKPRNILITNKGHHIKLIDLGFGWSESFILDLGYTRDFCAPEQLAAKTDQFSPATDIYALGKIMQHFGLAKDSVINHCLKDAPKERYQSVGELQKAIRKSENRSKTSKALFGLAGIALIGILFWHFFGQPKEIPIPVRPPAPEGAIPALFTINEKGDQVYFSKGNLQYKPYSDTWRFAENQYEYIGGDNTNIGQGKNARGWFDLFSWSSNGRPHGSINYQVWNIESDAEGAESSMCNAYGIDTCDLCDFDGQADWGYNAIINGGNQEGLWRTLTMDEWVYLLDKRTTSSGIRFTKARVDSQNGLLLLPDDWDSTVFRLFNINDDDSKYEFNTIPEPYWSQRVESQGAVFLPAAGISDRGLIGLVGNYGCYWSATHFDGLKAKDIYFSNTFFNHEDVTHKCKLRSVRLVRDK